MSSGDATGDGYGAETPDLPEPPVTGHGGVDAALASIDLSADVNSHPAALADALDVLAEALSGSADPAES
ncbi:MAG: hypothetical protein ACK5LN_04505 [Propioniciclava sp.]